MLKKREIYYLILGVGLLIGLFVLIAYMKGYDYSDLNNLGNKIMNSPSIYGNAGKCCLCLYMENEYENFQPSCERLFDWDCSVKKESKVNYCGDACTNLVETVKNEFSGNICNEYKIVFAGHSDLLQGYNMLGAGYDLCIDTSCSVYFGNEGCESMRRWEDLNKRLQEKAKDLPPNVSLTISGNQINGLYRRDGKNASILGGCASSKVTLTASCEPDFDKCGINAYCDEKIIGERKICKFEGELKELECCPGSKPNNAKWGNLGCMDSKECTNVVKISGWENKWGFGWGNTLIGDSEQNFEICTSVNKTIGEKIIEVNENIGIAKIAEFNYSAYCEFRDGKVYASCPIKGDDSRVLAKTSCAVSNAARFISSGQCGDNSYLQVTNYSGFIDGRERSLIGWSGDIDGFSEGVHPEGTCEGVVFPMREEYNSNGYTSWVGCPKGDEIKWEVSKIAYLFYTVEGNSESLLCGG